MNISKLVSIAFLLLGLTYTIAALQLPSASIGSPSAPKIFPLLVGVFTIGLALVAIAQEFRKPAVAGQAAGSEGFDRETLKDIGLTTVFALIYAVIFDRVGYVIATIIFLEGMLFVFNGLKNWKVNTIVAVIFSVFIYILFYKLLNVYLPPLPFFE